VIAFLSPLFLLGAAAATVPILLHLLKRQPEVSIKFAPVKLLRQAPVEHARRRRLRDLLLLALRVSALLLLALAFARPFVAAGADADSPGITIVALDTSLSLAAPGQFERARQLAREAVERTSGDQLVGVVTFAERAAVAAPASADRAMAIEAIDAASPGFEGTSYRSAFGAAAAAIDARASASTIVVVSDLQEGGWDRGDQVAVLESTEIELLDVGVPPPNVGVVAVRATREAIVPTVRNWGPEPRETRVVLTVDDRDVAQSDILVESGESVDVVLPRVRGTVAVVTVEDSDGLAADNARFLVLDTQGPPVVLVVTATGDLGREAFYLDQALASSSDTAFEVRGAAASSVATELTAQVNVSAVVLLSTRGLDTKGRQAIGQYMQSGGGVLVAAGPDLDGEVVADALNRALSMDAQIRVLPGGEAGTRSLTPGDVRHPVFRAFGAGGAALGLVTFERVASVIVEGCEILARFTTGEAAVVDCQAGNGRALVLASDLDNRWNNFPLHATFVPFVHEAVRYLSGPERPVSEYLVGRGPAAVRATPGVIQVPGADGDQRWIAVNVDPSESNPSRLSATEFEAAVTRLRGAGRSARQIGDREQEERQGGWRYALVLMVMVLAVESVVGTRSS
jgi:hypothetical protein